MALENKHYMVFSGGGMHGATHIGVVAYIKHVVGLTQFKGFAGTSIGAFVAMILACGETNIPRMFYWLTNPRFFARLIKTINVRNMFQSYGLLPSKIGVEYIESILNFYKPGAAQWTFAQWYERTQKELCVATVNITAGQVEYHSHKTTPNWKVADSVYASMCIPLVCEPMWIHGSCYYDGGLLNNFPIVQCEFPLDETVGCYLETTNNVRNCLLSPPSVHSWLRFIMEIVYIMCRISSNAFFSKELLRRDNIVVIPQASLHFLKVWANSSELYVLYLRGIHFAKKHFNKKP